MKQVVIIHGGHSFDSHDRYLEYLKNSELDYDRLKLSKKWKPWIAEQLTNTDVLLPSMPNSDNAAYDEWKLYFEKIIPFFGDDVRLIGHSLGGMFLVKYLHQNPLPSPVRQLILLAAGYNDNRHDYGSFAITSASGIKQSAREIHLFHSKDDFVVPYSEFAKFKADLPDAIAHSFEDRNHFLDAEFPELLELLQKD